MPISFFALPLQGWLQSNANSERSTHPHLIPWKVLFPFTCWKLWLACNEKIFNHKSTTQHAILYSSVQAATEFDFLAGTVPQPPSRIPHIIRWHPPQPPFLKLNTDGSALGNPGLAGAGGVLRDHWGRWISGFSLHVGLATNGALKWPGTRAQSTYSWN